MILVRFRVQCFECAGGRGALEGSLLTSIKGLREMVSFLFPAHGLVTNIALACRVEGSSTQNEFSKPYSVDTGQNRAFSVLRV